MGGITGALYAVGYKGLELEEFSMRTDWVEIFTDQPPRETLPYFQKRETGRYQIDFAFSGLKPVTPGGLIVGQKISLLFSSLTFPYEKINDFDNLPCPFRCVAADLITGNDVVLKSGSLAKAMRTTMAIPTIFSPVEWGDSLLIDGGVLNNLPVDVAKSMGADIIIAVDVGPALMERKKLATPFHILEQSIAMLGRDRWKKNVRDADLLITPDLTGYTMADFDNDKIKKIIKQGDLAAREHIEEFKELKKLFGLTRIVDPMDLDTLINPQIIDLQITGYTSLAFDYIYEKIGLFPGDFFSPLEFAKRISELKTEKVFEEIHYEVIPVSREFIRLRIRVKEVEKPVLFGIDIEGGNQISFETLYRNLGLKPGDSLDTEDLNRRIMDLYGLGYFETIQYKIEPVQDKQVKLTLLVRELPLRKLRFGVRYDDFHNLVIAASLLVTSPIVSGLRWENEIQFAGLTRFQTRLYYPSRTLNLPVYPFLRINSKDIPTRFFSECGDCIAEYKDRSSSVSLGFGLLDAKAFNFEFEYRYEKIDTRPNIAISDPVLFPKWKDQLRMLEIGMTIDLLDDSFVPRKGSLVQGEYEGSYEKWDSETPFWRIGISGESYKTFNENHTLRFYGYWGKCAEFTPLYRYLNQGRPSFFVGMRYDQLMGKSMSILRMDYRYEYEKTIFFKAMGNFAFDYSYRLYDKEYTANNLWGIGCGIQLYFFQLGIVEFIYSYGSRSIAEPYRGQSVGYVSVGTRF